ncbi:hypothetical protein SBADM41S_05487 [Streptomyces badius]
MPHHRIRLHTQRTPQRRQRHHHRKRHRLHHINPPQQRPTTNPTQLLNPQTIRLRQHLPQRPIHQRLQHPRTLTQPLRKNHTLPRQPRTHPHPLRPLTRKHKRQPTTGGRRVPGRRLAGGEQGQPRPQLLTVAACHDRATAQRGASPYEGVADVRRIHVGVLRQAEEGGGLVAQRAVGGGRDRPCQGAPRAASRVGASLGGALGIALRAPVGVTRGPVRELAPGPVAGGHRFLLDDHMGIGAAEAERGDARAPGPAVRGLPAPGPGEQFDGARRPVDVRRGSVDVQSPRQHTVPHRLDHLDHTRDTGRRLRVTDVRLHGAEPQRLVRRAVRAVRREQGLRLDRVAELRPRTVRLDRVDLGGRQPGVLQRGPDDPLLRGAARCGHAAGSAVLVDGGAADHAEHLVSVAVCVVQPLQQEHGRALAPGGAVGVGREGLAPAVGGEAALQAELDEGVRGRHHGDTARQRQRALAGAQGARGGVQGDQGGGAGRVDGHGGALEAQGVGDAAGEDAAGGAVAEVSREFLRDVPHPGAVVVVHDSGEDARGGAAYRCQVDAGALERLPGHFQQQPLLRVHGQRLARRDPEEGGVEVGGVVEESAFLHIRLPRLSGLGVVEPVDVPVPVLRKGRYAVDALRDELPEVLGRAHAARVAAGHPDDGDRSVLLGLHLAQLPPRLSEVGGRTLEVVEQLLFVTHRVTHRRHPSLRSIPARGGVADSRSAPEFACHKGIRRHITAFPARPAPGFSSGFCCTLPAGYRANHP